MGLPEKNKEFGILFGYASLSPPPSFHIAACTDHPISRSFIAIFIVATTTYAIVWILRNKREEKKEAIRKAGLIERGFGPLDGVGEKHRLNGERREIENIERDDDVVDGKGKGVVHHEGTGVGN